MDLKTLKTILPDGETLKSLLPKKITLPETGTVKTGAVDLARRAWAAELGAETARRGRMAILEICCGTGESTFPVAHMNENATICAVDRDPEAIREAQKKLLESTCGNVHFVCADAAALPYVDGMFDSAFVAFSLSGVADAPALLREMTRLVRRGGAVYCLEEVVREDDEDHPVRSAVRKALQVNELAGEVSGGKRRLQKSDLCRMMAECGLKHVGSYEHLVGAAVCCRGVK